MNQRYTSTCGQRPFDKFSVVIAGLLAVATLIGMCAWMLCCEPMSDDWFYAVCGHDYDSFWSAHGEVIHSFPVAVRSMMSHFVNVNGRLANAAHILFQPVPRPVEACLIACATAATLLMLVRLSRPTRRGLLPCSILAVVLLWTALPWWDTMQAYVYNMNYIVSSALSLAVVLAYARAESRGGALLIAYCFFCVLVGWWHEGFAVPLIAFAGLQSLADFRNRRKWYITASLCAGMFCNLALGTLGRFISQTAESEGTTFSSVATLLAIDLWPLWVAIGLLAIIAIIPGLRPTRSEGITLLILLAAALAGAAAGVMMRVPGRGVWSGNLFAILLILRVSAPWLARIRERLAAIAGAVFLIAYCAWLTSLVQWQRRESADIRAIDAMLQPRGPRTCSLLCYDLLPTDSVPWWLGEKVNAVYENFNHRKAHFSHYQRRREDMGIAPAACNGLAYQEWPAVPGNAELRGSGWQLFTDDPTMRHLRIVVGEPDDNMPPFDRLLLKLRPRDTYYLPWWPIPAITADGDTIYNVNFSHIPRTMRHRPILYIDALPHSEIVE
ncbi:MAG: hypothetical protein K2M55_07065 [Muribaculaceae bacterium]|nr:hypothetical protein [Muribaculaceae bacterium]